MWAMPAEGGEPVQVTRHGGHTPFESNDGKTIYYGKNDSIPTQLWRVPVGGGDENQVIDSSAHEIWRRQPVSGIYFISRSRLLYLNLATRKFRTHPNAHKADAVSIGRLSSAAGRAVGTVFADLSERGRSDAGG